MDDLFGVYRVVLTICALGMLVGTLELYAGAQAFAGSGLLAWRVLRLRPYIPRAIRNSPLCAVCLGRRGLRCFLAARVPLLLAVMVTPFGPLFTALMACLVATDLLFSLRRSYGTDGSDQMNTVVMVTILLCSGPHSTPFSLTVGLLFIALQASLAYSTSGVTKLVSPTWRTGQALLQILGTEAYGCRWLACGLARVPGASLTVCWAVICGELLLGVTFLLPPPASAYLLAAGAVFHLLCAFVMGLNRFVWAFISTYPAVFFTGGLIQSWLGQG